MEKIRKKNRRMDVKVKKSIVMFGASAFSKRVISDLERYFVIEAVCDNDHSKWGNLYEGKYPIVSVDLLKEKYFEFEVLIALNDKSTYMDVCYQLEKIGMKYRHVNEALYQRCIENDEDFFIDVENLQEIRNMKSNKRNIFLLTAPSHSNLGDQAQTYCTELLLKERYKDSRIFIYDEDKIRYNYYELLYMMKQHLKEEDIILLHSGYRLTNLYMVSEYIVEMMCELFTDRKMFFLPQTIHYTDKNVEKCLAEKIHDKITIMCRDNISYQNAMQSFSKAKIMLMPDIVTSLIGKYQFNSNRKGILFCSRNAEDGESLLTNKQKENLILELSSITDVSNVDTTISDDWREIARDRKYYIERELKYYSQFEVVITNRFHGMVFSLIANTPVIVLPTKDHKITAGLKWFEEIDYNGIYYCEKPSDIMKYTQRVLEENMTLKHSDYFYRKYFEKFDLDML